MLKYCIRSLLNGHKIIPTEIDAIFYLVLSDFLNNIFSNIETDSNYFSSDSLNHEEKNEMFNFSKDCKTYVRALGFSLLLSQLTTTRLKIDLK